MIFDFEYFVGTFVSILLCHPTFKCLATLLGTIHVWDSEFASVTNSLPSNCKRSVLRRQSRDTNLNMKRSVYCQYE